MNWQDTEYNRGVTVHGWGSNGFYFDIPDSSGNVNCVFSNRNGYAMNKSIVVQYYLHKMSGNPKLVGFGRKVPGGLAPNFRPMLTSGGILDNRWYPSGLDCGFLTIFDHAFTITIPIKPAHWQDVNGKPASDNPNKFKETVTNNGGIGIVFGWQNYFAHGLYVVNGHARFGLWSYKVQ